MGHHINAEGGFQSDKHPSLPPNRIRLNLENPRSYRALRQLAEDYSRHDAELGADLNQVLDELYAPIDYMPRCGDAVFHVYSGETWEVAYAEGEHLTCAGWPETRADLADCVVTRRATDEYHQKRVQEWIKGSGTSDRGTPCLRRSRVKALYAPEPVEG